MAGRNNISQRARVHIIKLVERWKVLLYGRQPGGSLPSEWYSLTDQLIQICYRQLPFIDVTPLRNLKELELQEARCQANPSLPWKPTRARRQEAAQLAVGACEEIKAFLGGGEAAGRKRVGKPTLEESHPLRAQVYERICRAHRPGDGHEKTVALLSTDEQFVRQVGEAALELTTGLVRNALAWRGQRAREGAH